jgi:hypothetical protein
LFRASGDFVVDRREPRLVRYLGNDSELIIENDIEVISRGCFSGMLFNFAGAVRIRLTSF